MIELGDLTHVLHLWNMHFTTELHSRSSISVFKNLKKLYNVFYSCTNLHSHQCSSRGPSLPQSNTLISCFLILTSLRNCSLDLHFSDDLWSYLLIYLLVFHISWEKYVYLIPVPFSNWILLVIEFKRHAHPLCFLLVVLKSFRCWIHIFNVFSFLNMIENSGLLFFWMSSFYNLVK